MKFQPDTFIHAITAAGAGWVSIGAERIEHHLLLHSSGERRRWDCLDFDALSSAHFAPLALGKPELVVFGSGLRLRFPRPEWVRPLIEAGIGIETMDTAAACRTYNILAAEGRQIIAALLLEPCEQPQNQL